MSADGFNSQADSILGGKLCHISQFLGMDSERFLTGKAGWLEIRTDGEQIAANLWGKLNRLAEFLACWLTITKGPNP